MLSAGATDGGRSRMVKLFRRHGLSIKPDAMEYCRQLVESLGQSASANIDEFIRRLSAQLMAHYHKNMLVDLITQQNQVQKQRDQVYYNSSTSVSNNGNCLEVIDAFSIPRYRYHHDQSVFLKYAIVVLIFKDYFPHTWGDRIEEKPSLFGPAASKALIFRDRYDLIKQRIMRNDQFKPPVLYGNNGVAEDEQEPGGDDSQPRFIQLTPIKNLLGYEGRVFYLFGMLAQLKQNEWYLEDLDADVRLDLSDTVLSPGIFTETSFVMIRGVYQTDHSFKVAEMVQPPPEHRNDSIMANKLTNFFGTTMKFDGSSVDLAELESDPNQLMLILSDVWLDQSSVLQKLRELLAGYNRSGIIPLAIILMGDFLSEPFAFDGTTAKKYQAAFNDLLEVFLEHPDISKFSKLIFVPGPNDPWSTNILPRPSLPDVFTERFRSRLPNAIFTTNPCRIKYCSKELVIFRQNLLSKMQRNAIMKPNMTEEPLLHRHLVNSLLSQSYLAPMPLHISPVYWEYENALRIYPAPHALVLGDRCEPYEVSFFDTTCMNPGAFSVTNFQFMVYFPATGTAEISQIE